MENLDFNTLTQTLIDWVIGLGHSVNDMNGGTAFALGIVTWFIVEQILRRILSWLRWIILAGVIVGLGFSIQYLFGEIFSRGGVPDLPGLELNPDNLIPSNEDSQDSTLDS